MPVSKFLKNSAGNIVEEAGVQSSAGAGDAGKIGALDSTGRWDTTMMPVGMGAETKSIVASEALAAGDFVNIYNNSGVISVRKADASNSAKRANGYVLAAVLNAAMATVYYGNLNNQKSGLTLGAPQFLSATTAGGTTETAPTTAGHLVQRLGVATLTTEMLVEIDSPIQLA
jgi:hypothetical protein